MVKAKLKTKDGRDAFLFGLSDGNIELLRQGRPIMFNLETIGGPPYDIVIMWGETEGALREQLVADLGEPIREIDTRRKGGHESH